jgi:hypothetical protein
MTPLAVAVCLAVFSQGGPGPGVTVAPAPPGAPVSESRFVVHARAGEGPWQRVPVYDFFDQYTYNRTETGEPHFALFESEGAVSVRVTVAFEVREHVVRPLCRAVPSDRKGNTILLTLDDGTRNAALEVNGEARKPLLLFTTPPDRNPPAKGPGRKPLPGGGVYFGPGLYPHEHIDIRDADRPVIYVAPGAVVDAHVELIGCRGFTLAGGGIIHCPKGEPDGVPLKIDRCSGEVRDVLLASREENWTVWLHGSDGVAFNNARVVGEIRDGIDPINTRNATLIGCYIQGHDDATSVKGLQWAGDKPVEHVLFVDCIMNNMGGGWGLCRFAMEQNAPRIHDVQFRNCDVIHNLANRAKPDYGHWSEGVFQIKPVEGKCGGISSVLLDGIRVEDCGDQEYLVEINPLLGSGLIDGVVVRDFRRVGGPWRKSIVKGNGAYRVRGVRLSGLFDGDRRVEGASGKDLEVGPGVDIDFRAEEKLHDPLKDWTKVHSRSAGWTLIPGRAGRDADESRASRTGTAVEHVVYRYGGMTGFFVRTLSAAGSGAVPAFLVSSDGADYRKVPVIASAPWSAGEGLQGRFCWPEERELAGAGWLKIEAPAGGDAGVFQISDVELVRFVK